MFMKSGPGFPQLGAGAGLTRDREDLRFPAVRGPEVPCCQAGSVLAGSWGGEQNQVLQAGKGGVL